MEVVLIQMKLLLLTISAAACIVLSACSNSIPRIDQVGKQGIQSQATVPLFDKMQLVQKSDAIVIGVVTAQEVQKDFTGLPATDTFIEVHTVYKGEPPETLEVRVHGGETSDTVYKVDGMADLRFAIGEEVLVFLGADKGDIPDHDNFDYYVAGYKQGKFSLDTQSEGTVTNDSGTSSFELNTLQSEIDDILKDDELLE